MTVTTPNPYRFGGAWGYLTDPSGMLQLGARFYWPEVGRFVHSDPAKDGINWYVYAANCPTSYLDPRGLRATAKQCARQYRKDLRRCDEDYASKRGTAVVTGAIGGGVGGAIGGAKKGAAVGTAVCPGAGTAAGSAKGGAIGAVAGAVAGGVKGSYEEAKNRKTCKERALEDLDDCIDDVRAANCLPARQR